MDEATSRQRNSLPTLDSHQTVLETINTLNQIKPLNPCLTMPRVLYGALENLTCPGAQNINALARSSFRYDEMSTLRFQQHAKKGDFASSKYGKVMMQVSNLSDTVIAQLPRNIHRPYKPECRPGVVPFPEAIFYLNHYIGSWERYSSRQDERRNRDEWEKRAYITTDNSCDQALHTWFSRFVANVGMERAQFLLGVERKEQ